jgi:hypothetical protein
VKDNNGLLAALALVIQGWPLDHGKGFAAALTIYFRMDDQGFMSSYTGSNLGAGGAPMVGWLRTYGCQRNARDGDKESGSRMNPGQA